MAGSIASLVLKIVSDVQDAQKGLAGVEASVKGAESAMGSMAIPAAAAAGAVILLGTKAAAAASDVEQAFGAVETVFKNHSDEVKAMARNSAEATGLATADYAQMAAVLGSQLKGMGQDIDTLAPKTDELISLGADLAATYGGTTADAVSALSALLRGERDPIEKYGVSIKQVDVNARLAADGIVTAEKAASDLAKAQGAVTRAQAALITAQNGGKEATILAAQANLYQAQAGLEAASSVQGLTSDQMKAATANATLALLTNATADAQGGFARETDTAAHAQQVAAAEMENASAAIGEALLPLVVLLAQAMATLGKWASENAKVVQVLGAVILVVAGSVLAINAAFKIYRAVTLAATAAQWLLNSALLANPLGLVLIAVLALVAGFVLLWTKSETFRNIVTGVFNAVLAVVQRVVAWITGAFQTLAGILSAPFNALLATVQRVVGRIMGLFNGFLALINRIMGVVGDLGKKVSGVLSNIPKLPFSLSVVPPATGTAPLVRGLAPLAVPTGGGTQGAVGLTLVLDGEVFGRATIATLRRYDRRNGPPQVLPRWS